MFHGTRKVFRSFKVTFVFVPQSEASDTARFITLIYCRKLFTHHISGMVETSLRKLEEFVTKSDDGQWTSVPRLTDGVTLVLHSVGAGRVLYCCAA